MWDILFRGQRTDNKEWVFGDLCRTHYAGGDGKRHNKVQIVNENGVFFDVIASTVGRFSGLRDKHKVMIFEDDIIRYTYDSPASTLATENGLKIRVGRVFWSEWRASFAVTLGMNGSDSSNTDVARFVRGRQIYEYVQNANTVEVIGNVFDNPSLLKEKKCE